MQLDNSVSKVIADTEAAREQVDRLLASNTLHAADMLRRLLRFLAEKTFADEADDLKEYTVGLEALGKAASYDPRQDAAVRLQASRLRRKLEDYYHNEGRNDALVIELPRGRLKIAWHLRSIDGPGVAAAPPQPVVPQAATAAPVTESRKLYRWRVLAMGLAILTLCMAIVTLWSLARPSQAAVASPAVRSTPELDALWSPFLSPAHHLIIAFVNPLFVRLQRKGGTDILYRAGGNNSWNDAISSPEFSVLKKALANPQASPTFNMVERSNLIATFALSQFFARRRDDVSLARADELSWQQFADNDVIVFGPFAIDGGQSALPVKPAFIVDDAGVRNLQPLAGEPLVYPDPRDHSPSDGEGLELVSVMPGPLGRTTVATFASNHKWGVIGGVQSLTDPAFGRVVVGNLRGSTGRIPPYYQIVFKVKYRDGTLTNTSYVTHRALALTQNAEAGPQEHKQD